MAGCAIWFVGLPGSGKSSISRCVAQVLEQRGLPVRYLEMDACRKAYFPNPQYTTKERRQAYGLFVSEAAQLVEQGHVVIMDGSAPKRSMREVARKQIPVFAEMLVRCPVRTAMEREASRPAGKVMADLYAKALERKRTGRQFKGLGQVIGVDVQFEDNPNAEFVLENGEITKEEACQRVLAFLDTWLHNA